MLSNDQQRNNGIVPPILRYIVVGIRLVISALCLYPWFILAELAAVEDLLFVSFINLLSRVQATDLSLSKGRDFEKD